jgi:L-asparagine transporter-like permease
VAYVCIFESRTTLEKLNDEAAKRNYRRAYLVLGIAMVVLPVTVVIIHMLGTWSNSRVVFFVEYAGVAVFAVYWLVKSREIAQILRQ